MVRTIKRRSRRLHQRHNHRLQEHGESRATGSGQPLVKAPTCPSLAPCTLALIVEPPVLPAQACRGPALIQKTLSPFVDSRNALLKMNQRLSSSTAFSPSAPARSHCTGLSSGLRRRLRPGRDHIWTAGLVPAAQVGCLCRRTALEARPPPTCLYLAARTIADVNILGQPVLRKSRQSDKVKFKLIPPGMAPLARLRTEKAPRGMEHDRCWLTFAHVVAGDALGP